MAAFQAVDPSSILGHRIYLSFSFVTLLQTLRFLQNDDAYLRTFIFPIPGIEPGPPG